MIPDDTVHVWHLRFETGPHAEGCLEDHLSQAELAAARLTSGDRRRRELGLVRGMVRAVMSNYLSLPAQAIRLSRGRWGKPQIAGLPGAPRFNVSHTATVALLAVTAEREVGVDVEDRRAGRDVTRMADRFFPEHESAWIRSLDQDAREAAFLRLWTRKEAVVKAAGGRLAQGLGLPVASAGSSLMIRDPRGALPGTWRVTDLETGSGRVATLALQGGRAFRIAHRTFDGFAALRSGPVPAPPTDKEKDATCSTTWIRN